MCNIIGYKCTIQWFTVFKGCIPVVVVIDYQLYSLCNTIHICSYFIHSGLYLLIFFKLIYFNWRLITLQYCSGFCHTLTWISHGYTCVPHPETPPTSSPSHSSGSGTSPEHPVSCIKPGLVIYFTDDNIHVSMQLSQIIPPSSSLTESKDLFLTPVSLLLSHI